MVVKSSPICPLEFWGQSPRCLAVQRHEIGTGLLWQSDPSPVTRPFWPSSFWRFFVYADKSVLYESFQKNYYVQDAMIYCLWKRSVCVRVRGWLHYFLRVSHMCKNHLPTMESCNRWALSHCCQWNNRRRNSFNLLYFFFTLSLHFYQHLGPREVPKTIKKYWHQRAESQADNSTDVRSLKSALLTWSHAGMLKMPLSFTIFRTNQGKDYPSWKNYTANALRNQVWHNKAQ